MVSSWKGCSGGFVFNEFLYGRSEDTTDDDGNHEAGDGEDPQDDSHGAAHEGGPVTVGQAQRPPQIVLHEAPQDQSQDGRCQWNVELTHEVAGYPDAGHQEQVEGAVVHGVNGYEGERDDAGHEYPAGDQEDSRKQAHERQVQHQQHDVAYVHGGDEREKHVGIVLDEERTRVDVVANEGCQHHGGRAAARYAQCEQRYQSSARGSIVRRFGCGHAPQVALAEVVVPVDQLLLAGIGHECSDRAAGSGKYADEEAHYAAADHRPEAADKIPDRDHDLVDLVYG